MRSPEDPALTAPLRFQTLALSLGYDIVEANGGTDDDQELRDQNPV